MERPTCGSCPYWRTDRPDNSMIEGDCRRNPPQFAACDRQYRDMRETAWDEWCGTWPGCDSNDFCGEHPDFPAYIASLKKPQ